MSTTWLLLLLLVGAAQSYKIGVAIADVTGPPVEIAFMGYGHLGQIGTGIHLRQFARAFIIEEAERRFVFVNVDVCMIGHGLRKQVVGRLQMKHGRTYTMENVMLSATHTHSAPGGYLQDMLFDLPTLGFVRQTFDALVDGIVESIQLAHDRMELGRIYVTDGEILETNINRSPTAYENNPPDERARYEHNVDKTMTQLRFVSMSGRPMGVISWYAVHPTSMNNTNTLISSDNQGFASILFEGRMNPGAQLGKGSFVAAFASSNLGDVSPNTRGPRCLLTGKECDVQTSACPNGDQCVAFGPGRDMSESTYIIAHHLMDKAWELWHEENAQEIKGPLRFVHQYVDMPAQVVPLDPTGKNSSLVHGCLQAMGYSFGAGTTDGPGAFNFKQGTTTPNALWNALRNFLATPTPEDIRCQSPKPILLATGQMDFPFEWQPRIVSTQIALVGQMALVGVPGEFTTMSGRRLRSTVKDALISSGAPENTRVVVAGLSNIYADYIATPEEYELQRYEGASTIFGKHTLTIYLHKYAKLAHAVAQNEPVDPGPEPPELMNDLISLTTPVIYDTPSWHHEFGDCIEQPAKTVKPGQTVTARFVSGNPRNNLMHNATYLTVERHLAGSEWRVVATDANWETKFEWTRKSMLLGNSEVKVTWTVPPGTPAGEYRIRHFGHYKFIFGSISPYRGSTKSFKVVERPTG